MSEFDFFPTNHFDFFRYALARRGSTPEQIEQAEQSAINASLAAGCDVTYDLLALLTQYNSLPAVELTPAPQSVKKAQKTPYYHKDKAKWWK
jgi:hypothetical protein